MSKEPFKSFINKVGTFRTKKNASNRPSVSDLRFADSNDENMFRSDENSNSIHDSDLDTTSKSFSVNNMSFRSSMLTSNSTHLPNISIYDHMTEEQINEEFEKSILTGVNLKSDKDIERMRNLPLEHKKNLLINMRKNENEADDKATNMANALRDAVRNSKSLKENLKNLHKVIKRISVCIASKPVSWLEEFEKSSGFQALQEIITDYKIKYSILYNNNSGNQYFNSSNFLTSTLLPNSQATYNSNEFKDKDTLLNKEIRFECIKILKSFVNTSYGIGVVLESKPTMMAIATAIDCNDTPTMNVACSVLAVLAVLEQEKVLKAISESAKFTGNHRFYSIVKGLTINEDKDLKISSMILINALICNADSLDFKIHLRSDFNKCGLSSAIETLKMKYGSLDESIEKESDKLLRQIEIYENHANDNFEKIENNLDNIMGFWDDSKICFEYLYNSIKDSPAECCLLSILQHLLLIRDDFQIRYSYFRLIEECVSRIALHRDGRDPDFEYGSKFDFDIDAMLKAIKEAAQDGMSELGGRLTNADSAKLENAISQKQELEAKCHTLETKLRCTEEALNILKEKVPNEIANEIEGMLKKRLNAELSSPPPPPPPPPMIGGPPPPPPPPLMGISGPPPPPPPPPMMGGPPPPPPPPPLVGGPPPPPPMIGGPPPPPFSLQRGPPPPPINVLPFGMKEKKKFNVDQPLKRINWNKVQTQRLKESSFWVKANEEKYATEDILQILMENFSTKPSKTKASDLSKSNLDESNLKKKTTAKELKYLDEKQAQNLSILLKSFKADQNEVYKWLISCDLERLSQNSLEQLEKFLPEDKILIKYQELKENIEDLDPSEKFLVIISQIKGLRKRIRSLIFKCKFPEQQDEIRIDLVAGTQACIDVRNSEKFQKLLEVFLLVGNFLNSGSNTLEGSIGFDMKYLPKFYGTKANDNKRTLLHTVAQIITDKYPQIENFYEDFTVFLEQASKIDAGIIQKNLTEMKSNISNSEMDLKNFKNKLDQNDKYTEIMEAFLKDAGARYETLDCMFNKMNDSYKDLADFYSFEITKYPLGEFFTDLKTFCNQFEQCLEENIKFKETEEKIRRAEEERLNREKEKQARKAQKEKLIQSTTNRGDGDTGVMDNLLEALQSGKLFEATNPNTSGPGRRRPMRRDHNLMADFRRTMHKQSPRAVLQEVQ